MQPTLFTQQQPTAHPGGAEYFVDDCQVTHKGTALLARAIYDELVVAARPEKRSVAPGWQRGFVDDSA